MPSPLDPKNASSIINSLMGKKAVKVPPRVPYDEAWYRDGVKPPTTPMREPDMRFIDRHPLITGLGAGAAGGAAYKGYDYAADMWDRIQGKQ